MVSHRRLCVFAVLVLVLVLPRPRQPPRLCFPAPPPLQPCWAAVPGGLGWGWDSSGLCLAGESISWWCWCSDSPPANTPLACRSYEYEAPPLESETVGQNPGEWQHSWEWPGPMLGVIPTFYLLLQTNVTRNTEQSRKYFHLTQWTMCVAGLSQIPS